MSVSDLLTALRLFGTVVFVMLFITLPWALFKFLSRYLLADPALSPEEQARRETYFARPGPEVVLRARIEHFYASVATAQTKSS